MTPLAEQLPHLRFGDHVARRDLERRESGPQPAAGCLALLVVVLAEAPDAGLGAVMGRDLAGQVRVPVPGRELVQPHHEHGGARADLPGQGDPLLHLAQLPLVPLTSAPGVWSLGFVRGKVRWEAFVVLGVGGGSCAWSV